MHKNLGWKEKFKYIGVVCSSFVVAAMMRMAVLATFTNIRKSHGMVYSFGFT